jgi:outer membrane protein OmpA-like peptidoglycan-associated protein
MHIAVAATTAVLAGTVPALAGPDFVADDRVHPLAASDVRGVLDPTDELLFALDDAALDATAMLQLAAVVRWLDGRPDDRVVIEGRADSSGPADHNAELAGQRAEAVRNHLIGRGVDPDRIVIAVYGENGPRRATDREDRRVTARAATTPINADAISASR